MNNVFKKATSIFLTVAMMCTILCINVSAVKNDSNMPVHFNISSNVGTSITPGTDVEIKLTVTPVFDSVDDKAYYDGLYAVGAGIVFDPNQNGSNNISIELGTAGASAGKPTSKALAHKLEAFPEMGGGAIERKYLDTNDAKKSVVLAGANGDGWKVSKVLSEGMMTVTFKIATALDGQTYNFAVDTDPRNKTFTIDSTKVAGGIVASVTAGAPLTISVVDPAAAAKAKITAADTEAKKIATDVTGAFIGEKWKAADTDNVAFHTAYNAISPADLALVTDAAYKTKYDNMTALKADIATKNANEDLVTASAKAVTDQLSTWTNTVPADKDFSGLAKAGVAQAWTLTETTATGIKIVADTGKFTDRKVDPTGALPITAKVKATFTIGTGRSGATANFNEATVTIKPFNLDQATMDAQTAAVKALTYSDKTIKADKAVLAVLDGYIATAATMTGINAEAAKEASTYGNFVLEAAICILTERPYAITANGVVTPKLVSADYKDVTGIELPVANKIVVKYAEKNKLAKSVAKVDIATPVTLAEGEGYARVFVLSQDLSAKVTTATKLLSIDIDIVK